MEEFDIEKYNSEAGLLYVATTDLKLKNMEEKELRKRIIYLDFIKKVSKQLQNDLDFLIRKNK